MHPNRFEPSTRAIGLVLSALAILVLMLLAVALPATAQEKVLHQGRWTQKGFAIEGAWKIVEEGGRRFVVLDQAFRTKSAPDLKLFLSPRNPGEISSLDATDGAARVGELTSNQGAQRIAIPAGVDLGRYRTLVLHCEKYSKLWGVAALGG